MPYHLFDTAFGTCAIAWSDVGLTRVLLPEATRERAEAHVHVVDGEPATEPLPSIAADAIQLLQRYLSGDDVSLHALELDAQGVSSFNRTVYRVLRTVPRASTVTYGELARDVGRPGAARAVGLAMGRNPWPVIVPCHRVLAGNGKLGGFSAPGGTATKEKLLALEGVSLGDPVLPGLFET
ncbi:MAG: methylated-DNA--[protein]-cysteine S-methyltransferase [Pseudomonadota bacterium]